MCIYIYICMNIRIFICVYIYIYVCVYIYICRSFLFSFFRESIHIYTREEREGNPIEYYQRNYTGDLRYICVYIYIYINQHICICPAHIYHRLPARFMCIYIHICIYIYVYLRYICVYIYIHIHIHICILHR